jgi:thiamine-phosphate pyrophosphorylase
LALDADGVHIGQDDLPIHVARKIWSKMLGISVSNVDQAIEAEKAGVDYISVSPIYPTPTKLDAPLAVGLEGLKKIRETVKTPIVAIGGINKNTVKDVMKAGADGVAVVSAIVGAENPRDAALEIFHQMHGI